VSGYDVGSFLAGSFGRTQERAPDRDGLTGRVKLGTESSGGFRNITISNCSFDRSRGLALETVDGGDVEDVTVTNLTMRDVTTAPLVAGIPGHPVEDVDLVNVHILYRGGGSREDATREPPENEDAYPEPSMFGTLPVYGLYVRYARNLTLRDVEVGFEREDLRPASALRDVSDGSDR
jgi:polygalacturonase